MEALRVKLNNAWALKPYNIASADKLVLDAKQELSIAAMHLKTVPSFMKIIKDTNN